jgi:L-glutamine-phosphate cytidylyltransferase
MTKVIILAAGKGERLLPLTRNTPKSLLEIGKGMTILENQLAVFKACGIKDVIIVTGYKSEQIEAKIKDYTEFDIKIIYNPFYEITNNLISAWMARYEMIGDFVILNGDVIFNTRVIEGLLKSNHNICMAIQRKSSYDQEDMKVITATDSIVRISKGIPLEEANGESIGIIKFNEKGKNILLMTMEKMAREKDSLMAFFPAALQRIADESYPVNYLEISTEDSAEVDFHPDLELVKTNLALFSSKIVKWRIEK